MRKPIELKTSDFGEEGRAVKCFYINGQHVDDEDSEKLLATAEKAHPKISFAPPRTEWWTLISGRIRKTENGVMFSFPVTVCYATGPKKAS